MKNNLSSESIIEELSAAKVGIASLNVFGAAGGGPGAFARHCARILLLAIILHPDRNPITLYPTCCLNLTTLATEISLVT
jgi:hypothetical protein